MSNAGSAAPQAEVNPAKLSPITLRPIGTYQTGVFDSGASEIVGYDARTEQAFVVNAQAGTVDVLDISRPRHPELVATLDTPGANSVAVSDGLVAVAEQAEVTTRRGTVSFFRAGSLAKVAEVPAGSLPDMVTFTPDGTTAVVANEGEPEGYCDGQIDPAGSVSVIDLSQGPRAATSRLARFTSYNGQAPALRAQGIRIFGPGATVAQDLEPEYVAINPSGRRAWVTLQENNALAIVSLRTAEVVDIEPLGTKDHSRAGQGLDPSDEDGGANIATRPVAGLYQPDGIDTFRTAGSNYTVLANEGDARDYDCFAEEERVADLTLDPASFPDAAALQSEAALGRLNVTSTLGEGQAGYHDLFSFGARSISIRDSRGGLVWDSGDQLETYINSVAPEFFNSDHAEGDSADSRSDNKGPEPEGVEVARVQGHTYAFVGLERESGIVVYDITKPAHPRIVTYADNRVAGGDPEAGTAGDLGPEGLLFVSRADSPTGRPLLIVGNEVSGTTTIWTVTRR